MPALTIREVDGRIRLQLGCFARGEGPTLQEAADDLVHALLRVVFAFRASGFSASTEVWPDLDTMDFLYEFGEIAAAGGDIRSRVLG